MVKTFDNNNVNYKSQSDFGKSCVDKFCLVDHCFFYYAAQMGRFDAAYDVLQYIDVRSINNGRIIEIFDTDFLCPRGLFGIKVDTEYL